MRCQKLMRAVMTNEDIFLSALFYLYFFYGRTYKIDRTTKIIRNSRIYGLYESGLSEFYCISNFLEIVGLINFVPN